MEEKSNKKAWVIASIVFLSLILVLGGTFIFWQYFLKKTETKPVNSENQTLKLDSIKEATHLSKVAGEKSAYWVRGFDVVWNSIEHEKGKFDWSETDGRMKEDTEGETYLLSIIWPYANWDQKTCHSGEKYMATGHLKRGNEELSMGAPCDMNAYGEFIQKAVERYDGDGVDDMPGLKTPIKYWEILNEPEMQGGGIGGAGEELKFFVGTPQEYLEILKTSYQAIKRADSGVQVLHAGMAGMQENFQKFWDPIFAAGAGQYFDIANIHTISTDEKREDLYMIKFKKYLDKYGIKDKPIWITEVQFGNLMDKPQNLKSFEVLMAKASVFALALGADKLFLIENWTQWDNPNAFKPPEGDKNNSKEGKKEPKPKIDLSNNSTHKVYLNLIKQLNSFDKVETISEKFTEGSMDNDGATSQVGQYKFTSDTKVVYVLWGFVPIPAEIKGKVKITDIYGVTKESDASAIQLSDSPVFVEIIK